MLCALFSEVYSIVCVHVLGSPLSETVYTQLLCSSTVSLIEQEVFLCRLLVMKLYCDECQAESVL